MKHTVKIKFVLFLLVTFMLLSSICIATDVAPISSANELVNDTNDSVEDTYEFIASDVYEFDDDVVIDSIIDGNAFACGNNVTVTGEIGGDVFAFGNTVTVEKDAYVHGSIFVFANQFVMKGICYDIYGGAQSITLSENAIVARDVRIAAEKIHINGQVKRDAYLSTNELVFPENASTLISGNLSYSSTSEFVIDKNVVGGEIKFTQEVSEEATVQEKITDFIIETISALLYAFVIVLLTIWLAPNFKNKVGNTLQKKAPLSLGIGLLTLIIIIFGALILLFLTRGLGVSISIAAVTIFILALTISQTVFSMGCAKLIAEKSKKDNIPMFIGMTLLVVIVLRLIELIPFVGGLVGFLVTMTGLGMILVHLMNRNKSDENQKVIVDKPETDTPISE